MSWVHLPKGSSFIWCPPWEVFLSAFKVVQGDISVQVHSSFLPSCYPSFISFVPFPPGIQITLSYLLTFPPSLTLSASPLRPVCQCWECLPSPGDSSCQSACTNPQRTGWINNNLLQPVISWRRKSRREEGKEREWKHIIKGCKKDGGWREE